MAKSKSVYKQSSLSLSHEPETVEGNAVWFETIKGSKQAKNMVDHLNDLGPGFIPPNTNLSCIDLIYCSLPEWKYVCMSSFFLTFLFIILYMHMSIPSLHSFATKTGFEDNKKL